MDFYTGKPNIDYTHLGILSYQFMTQISSKSIVQNIFGNKNDISQTEALAAIKNQALKLSKDTDFVYDIKISTSSAQFKDGQYLITTIIASIGSYLSKSD